MKKSEFKDRMYKAKVMLRTSLYCCWTLLEVFKDRPYKSNACNLYLKIIKGRDNIATGMFGPPKNKKNQADRLMSLEMFEYIMIDEGLYKDL